MEEENNDLVVNNDVPETSENENLDTVQVNASENDEQVQEEVKETPTQEDIERQIEERANKLFEERVETRLIRDRIKREREENKELSKYRHLESIMRAGLGAENLDDVITKTTAFYKEQGTNVPEYHEEFSLSERDERVLAEADAKEIISLGKSEMEKEANRIASIPAEKRNAREKTVFDTLCKELISLRDIDTLKSKGYQTEILNDKKFVEFRKQFNVNTPISSIYEMYKKVNGQTIAQPASPGSAKSTTTIKQIKDYYSPEDFDKLTREELKDPKIMAVVDKSRLQWFKNLTN